VGQFSVISVDLAASLQKINNTKVPVKVIVHTENAHKPLGSWYTAPDPDRYLTALSRSVAGREESLTTHTHARGDWCSMPRGMAHAIGTC